MTADVKFQPTPPERHRAALELLFSAMTPSERVAQMATSVAALRDGRLSLDGLLEAVRGDDLVGCVWASAMGGRAALLWPPQIVPGEDEATAQGLLAAINAWMLENDVRLANAFVADDRSPDARRLLKSGYHYTAEILYLVSDRTSFPNEDAPSRLTYEPFDEADEARLAEIIERTYEDTLDCPSLNGQRRMADVLAGYRQTGEYDPQRWFIARDGHTDVGCLLLADHPAEDQWELVYQGVVPAARGQGFGLDMTRHAQRLAGQAGRNRLVLAVDADNRPAIAGYTAAGFHQWDRRFVYVKFIDEPGQADAR